MISKGIERVAAALHRHREDIQYIRDGVSTDTFQNMQAE